MAARPPAGRGRGAGGLWARCQRLAHQHFPTESLYNLLRPLGIANGHMLHDIYNLLMLPVLCGFCFRYLLTGASFDAFVVVAYAYFIGDLLWVVCSPSCVKSPGVIAGHHCLTMLYMLYPLAYPQLRHYMVPQRAAARGAAACAWPARPARSSRTPCMALRAHATLAFHPATHACGRTRRCA